jgi:hypothetical protein
MRVVSYLTRSAAEEPDELEAVWHDQRVAHPERQAELAARESPRKVWG